MLSFAIQILGISWIAAATLVGMTLGDVWSFHHVMSIAHMGVGLVIFVLGAMRD